MLNCLFFFFFFVCLFVCLFVFVLFNAVKTDTKLTLHHMWNIFIIQLTNLDGYIFEKFFTIKMFLGWTSGFHAIDDWPRAHWDETEFNVMLFYYDFYFIKIPVYILSTDLARNGLALRPSLKSKTNIDYFLFISYGIESTCIRLSHFLFFYFFFGLYIILTGQSNLSINFRVRLITSAD